jgi:hypothetical protein
MNFNTSMLQIFCMVLIAKKCKFARSFKNVLGFLTHASLALSWVSQTLTFLKAISTLQAPLDCNRKKGLACYLFLSN